MVVPTVGWVKAAMYLTYTDVCQGCQEAQMQENSSWQDEEWFSSAFVGTLGEMAPSDFGQRVRIAREARGLSQSKLEQQIAKILGKTQRGVISRVESGHRGKNPSDKFISACAQALRSSREWLVEGKGSMQTEMLGVPRRSEVPRRVTTAQPTVEGEYKSFTQWMSLVGSRRLDHGVLQALALERFGERDPGLEYWSERYSALLKAKHSIENLELEPIEGDDIT